VTTYTYDFGGPILQQGGVTLSRDAVTGFRWPDSGMVAMNRKRQLIAKNSDGIILHRSTQPLELNETYSFDCKHYEDGVLVWAKRQDGSLIEWTNSKNKTTVWLPRRNDESVV
jgi:hypothetical protein